MIKVLLDTNVLLDYCGATAREDQIQDATQLISLLCEKGDGFIATPTILKDVHYLSQVSLKRRIKAEKGTLSPEDTQFVSKCSYALLDTLRELCVVVSESVVDCEIARSLCKQHNDYEDNLIAAVALRCGVDFIVTRDEKFMKHCPVACLTPKDMLAYLESGALHV